MRWLPALSCAAVLALAAATAAAARPVTAARDGRPNVLVIMTDDQAAADVRYMTNVRRLLVAKGTTFSNAITSFPLCCPSRASFITGQFAHNHGVSSNFEPSYYSLRSRGNSLPVWLHRAGYFTSLIGKYLTGYGTRDPRDVPPGYSDWRGLLDFSSYDYFNYVLNQNGRLRTRGDPDYARALVELARRVSSERPQTVLDVAKLLLQLFRGGYYGAQRASDYSPDVTASITARILRGQRRARRPFFVWWAPAAPHREDVNSQRGRVGADPRPPPRLRGSLSRYRLPRPPSFDERDNSDKPRLVRALPLLSPKALAQLKLNYQGRIGSLLSVDEGVGRLLRVLRSTGQLKNTVIMFVSDNGWVQGEHRIPGDKYVPYEESLRVPLIFRGPGFPARRVVRRQVSNVDLAPTILALAGARARRLLDGLSLLPFAHDPARAPERALPIEATGNLFPVEGFPQPYDVVYSGLRSPGWKYVRWSYGDRELYDLRRDPYELRNLAGEPRYEATVARLERRRRTLSRCAGATCNTVRGD